MRSACGFRSWKRSPATVRARFVWCSRRRGCLCRNGIACGPTGSPFGTGRGWRSNLPPKEKPTARRLGEANPLREELGWGCEVLGTRLEVDARPPKKYGSTSCLAPSTSHLLPSSSRRLQFVFAIVPQQHPMIHYLGYFAGVLTVASFLPQVIRTWRTHHTRDLSFAMFALLVTASTLWVIYGIVIGNWPVILTNLGMVALNGAIGVAKLRFG